MFGGTEVGEKDRASLKKLINCLNKQTSLEKKKKCLFKILELNCIKFFTLKKRQHLIVAKNKIKINTI